MKPLASIGFTLVMLLVAVASSAADVRSDIIVGLDTNSIADVTFGNSPPSEFPVLSGSNFLIRTDDATCSGVGCTAELNYLRVTFGNFELTVDVSVDSGSVGSADVTMAEPTIAIFGPIPMTNQGSGFVVPVGTPVSFNATMSGTANIGNGPEQIPSQPAATVGALTSPLFISWQVAPQQVATIDGTLSFDFKARGNLEGHDIIIDIPGSVGIIGSGKTPFGNVPPRAVASAPSTANCSQPVNVSASGSTDADNNIASFTWLRGSQVLATGVNAALTLPPGQQTVTLVVTDTLGAQGTTTFTVQVDDSPPTIAAPADVTISSCVGANIGQATATGCGVTITNNAPLQFPLGTTVVIWTATDSSNRTASAQQRVTATLGDDSSCCPAGTNVIAGTSNGDTLRGTDGSDCILGRGGDDVIDALGGDDFISGGAGRDTIVGGFGNDHIFGGDGDDTIDSGPDDDFIDGGNGVDTCSGGTGTNAITKCEVAAFCTAACCSTSTCTP